MRRAWVAGLAATCCMLVCSCWLAAQQQPADIILYNGKVLTVDKNFTIGAGQLPSPAIRLPPWARMTMF